MGKAAAKLLKAFGCRVLGLTRNKSRLVSRGEPCEDIDEWFEASQLRVLVSKCDYLCAALPKTPETDNLIGQGLLEECAEKQPVLINIGRGNIISDPDLLLALEKNWLRGAILDVFNEEPLPETHPFWKHDRVIITPHVAGVSRAVDIAECVRRNVRRYEDGQALFNMVDWELRY